MTSSRYRKLALKLSAAVAALLFGAGVALAQVPSLPGPPYNVDLGANAATIKNTAQGAATVNSPMQTNLAYSGVLCTFNQTAIGGTPAITYSIQFLDSASGLWQTMVTSGSITTGINTPFSIGVGTSFAATDTPFANYVGVSLRLPRFWRVQETVAGTGTPTTTGTIGCNVFR
jgi:hypothetical protein